MYTVCTGRRRFKKRRDPACYVDEVKARQLDRCSMAIAPGDAIFRVANSSLSTYKPILLRIESSNVL